MAAAAAKAMNQHPGRLPLVLMLTPGTPWCVVQAREAYEQACKLEPNDAQLQLALQRAAAREGKQVAEGKAKSQKATPYTLHAKPYTLNPTR